MGDVDLEAKSSHGGTELMCRLCMKTNGGALNIFVSIATSGLPVWNVIQDLIRVQISEGDGLPDTVCCNCLRKLMEFSEFKEMCIKSASELEIRKINAINTTLKVEIKEEPNISDEESEQGQSYREENIVHNETEEMQVACDPLDVDQVAVKEEASLDASTHEMESYGGDDDSNDSSQEKTGYNVVCLPIDMGKQYEMAEESDSSETMTAKEEPSDNEYKEKSNLGMTGQRQGIENMEVKMSVARSISCTNKKRLNEWNATKQGEKSVNLIVSRADINQSMESMEEVQGPRSSARDNATCSNNEERTETMNEADYEHLKNHVVDWSEYVCNYCGFKCSTKTKLSTHISSHVVRKRKYVRRAPCKEREPVVHECETCGKKFDHKGHLTTHKVTHTNLKPFKCQVCNKGFKRKTTLNSHSQVHLDSKRYICEKCGKGFRKHSFLMRHSVVHSEEKPFQCTDCDKGFYHKSGLLNHLATHSWSLPGRNFRCDICGQWFNLNSDLSRHKLTVHESKKSFRCEKCGMEFSQMGDLVTHSVDHTGLKCIVCGQEFTRLNHLLSHSALHSDWLPASTQTTEKRLPQQQEVASSSSCHIANAYPVNLSSLKCQVSGEGLKQLNQLPSHTTVRSISTPVITITTVKRPMPQGEANSSLRPFINADSPSQSGFKSEAGGGEFRPLNLSRPYSVIQSDLARMVTAINAKRGAQQEGVDSPRPSLNAESVTRSGFRGEAGGGDVRPLNLSRPYSVIRSDSTKVITKATNMRAALPGESNPSPRSIANADSVSHSGFKTKVSTEDLEPMDVSQLSSVVHSNLTPSITSTSIKRETQQEESNSSPCPETDADSINRPSSTCEASTTKVLKQPSKDVSSPSTVRIPDNPPFRCGSCGKVFNRKVQLEKHAILHDGLKSFKCETCGELFFLRSAYEQHLTKHTEAKVFKCAVCDEEFERRKDLTAHSATHEGAGPYKCETCNKEFIRRDCFLRHKLRHVDGHAKMHICSTCGKKFNKTRDLTRHVEIHSAVKPHICETCGKGFCRKSSLVTHSVIHLDLLL
ncbi:zinc finger protein 99-like [Ischnura elegans]|uniref:zinc finger protein 99-like n=1 Tax=Ischnura elegans TaxID=197161 RepID=UPI001ED87CD3|nr:zinc finger protein 99-like [Ischnura elegans]